MNKNIIALLSAVLVIVIAVFVFILNGGKNERQRDNENSTNLSSEDPFKFIDGTENTHASEKGKCISSNIVNLNSGNMTIEYDGAPILLEYEFSCGDPCVMGLMIYVNGFLQPYTVKPGQETVMHTVELGSDDTKRFKFEFTPVCGAAGENLRIVFANIYNARVIELSNSVGANTFGSNHKISQSLPWTLKMNAKSPAVNLKSSGSYDIKEFSNADKENFTRTNSDGNKRNMLDDTCITEVRENDRVLGGKLKVKKGEPAELNIYVYGNNTGKYRVSLYGDFLQIPIGGYNYIDITVKKDAYTVISFSADFDALKIKNLYAVAVPLDFNNFLEKSPSVYIVTE